MDPLIEPAIQAFILDAAGAKDRRIAMLARLLATGAVESISSWAHDESERGTPEALVAFGLVSMIGMLLTIPMSWAKPGHEETVARLLTKAITEEINKLAKEKVEFMKETRG